MSEKYQDKPPHFFTLGMFILDEFEYIDEKENVHQTSTQIGGGGTYAVVGARIWLSAQKLGMILVDRGNDFPPQIQSTLERYGKDMWFFRDHPNRQTTRAVNRYKGEHRGFEYLTPRIRLTPKDILNSRFARPTSLHFICSPTRAAEILAEIQTTENWRPITIYEPIPDKCIPEELRSLVDILPKTSIFSPNAEESLSLLSLPGPPRKEIIEQAAGIFLQYGVGDHKTGYVIIRSGPMGAYIVQNGRDGMWIDAFFSESTSENVVDVTGAGNSFLGGLAAGLDLCNGDVTKAAFYATISASFTVQQFGLPHITDMDDNQEQWNFDSPMRRLLELQARHKIS